MEHEKEHFLTKLQKIPISIPLITSLICAYGFILLYSAAGGNLEPWAFKQILIFSIFMPISVFIAMLDLRLIYHLSYVFYIFTVILLIIVDLFGKSAMGATRWLDLGIFTIQPSELVKIAVVLMLARYFNDHNKSNRHDLYLIIPTIASLIPIALVVKQPDLGTGIVTLLVVITIFFTAGVRLIYFIISGVSGLIAMPLIWLMMHAYQKNRVLTFLDPERDPLGAGYNIIQSKIAIGSGGFFGKGLLEGSQSQLDFLPEHQTDFIFAFLTEELGFLGGIVLMALYAILIISSLSISTRCRSDFAKLLIVGITIMFFCHVFVNIAMVMGLLPVVGIPLPLVSYGRTMIVSMLIGFGLVMNAAVNNRNIV